LGVYRGGRVLEREGPSARNRKHWEKRTLEVIFYS